MKKILAFIFIFQILHLASTAQDIEQIEKDFDRDHWMTANEAKEYGLVDEVLLVNKRKEKKD